MIHPKIKNIIWSVLAMTLLAFTVAIFSINVTQASRFSIGSIVLLILPGLSLSYVFWDYKHFSTIERMLMSMALSIATIPTITYVLTKYNVPINLRTTLIVVCVVTFLGVLGIFIRRLWIRPSDASKTN